MALLKSQISQRIAAIIDAKFTTYAGDIGSSITAIKGVLPGPIIKATSFPRVGVFFETQDSEDAPQESGDDRVAIWQVVMLHMFPTFSAANAAEAEDAVDVIEYLLKKEKKLLHPSTGEALQYSPLGWPINTAITWQYTSGRRGAEAFSITRLSVRINDTENY